MHYFKNPFNETDNSKFAIIDHRRSHRIQNVSIMK